MFHPLCVFIKAALAQVVEAGLVSWELRFVSSDPGSQRCYHLIMNSVKQYVFGAATSSPPSVCIILSVPEEVICVADLAELFVQAS